MQKQKENFCDKFSLLNSQEYVADIKWSSSESSDVENVSRNGKYLNVNNKNRRKRKYKKTTPKNISNLSITILDTSKDHTEVKSGQKSPILQSKSELKVLEKSPTFAPTVSYARPQKCLKVQPSSPVLTCKVSTLQSNVNSDKSPILLLKHKSPKVSPSVKKKLFNVARNDEKVTDILQDKISINVANYSSKNEIKSILDRRKTGNPPDTFEIIEPKSVEVQSNTNLNKISNELLIKQSKGILNQTSQFINFETQIVHPERIKIEIPDSQDELSKNSQVQSLDDGFAILKSSNSELVRRSKSYFENHFSSANASQSQHSISDCPTQKNSKSSEDVEIISITTQVNSNRGSFQSDLVISKNPSPISSQSAEYGTEKAKKTRCKKDGLAYHLNALIRRQNANISLWQHERFLVDNSNFLIPKGEYSVFLIQKVSVKFGSYLLEGIDVNDSNVLILISTVYVQDSNICENTVLKLYEPYKVLDYKENCKLIINACKFECTHHF